MEKSVELLFNYLSDIMHDTSHTCLDINELHKDCRKLGEGIKYFAECLREVQEFSKSLSQGNLNAELPSRQNELAAPLKDLHAALKHITWQSERVAEGDYRQHVEFMGDFANSFNAMIEQLDQRQKALDAEIKISNRKTLALEQNNNLFEIITAETSLLIFVLSLSTEKPLFMNKAAEGALTSGGAITQALNIWLETAKDSGLIHPSEIKISTSEGELFFSVKTYPIQMLQEDAIAYVLRDITREKQEARKLEVAANIDSLTSVYNRYFGMTTLRTWLSENRAFSLCFIDIDYLKFVNDSFGHVEGDYYIVNVADSLITFFPEGVVSRIGGDEFMVLIADMNAEDTESRFHQLREQMHKSSPSKTEGRYTLSISYGIVEVEQRCPLKIGDLLGLADERMYHFKRAHKAQRSVTAR